MFGNMTIRGKLALGFALMLIIVSVVAYFGIFYITRINNENHYAQNYVLFRYNTLQVLELEVFGMRHVVAMMALNVGNEHVLTEIWNDFTQLHNRTKSILSVYHHSLLRDPRMTSETQEDAIRFATLMDTRIMQYIAEVIEPMFLVAMVDPNNEAEIERLLALGIYVYASINSVIVGLSYATYETLYEINISINDLSSTAILVIMNVTIIGIVIGIFIVLFISKNITKSILLQE